MLKQQLIHYRNHLSEKLAISVSAIGKGGQTMASRDIAEIDTILKNCGPRADSRTDIRPYTNTDHHAHKQETAQPRVDARQCDISRDE